MVVWKKKVFLDTKELMLVINLLTNKNIKVKEVSAVAGEGVVVTYM